MRFIAPDVVDLEELARGTERLTPAVCAHLAEAAAVCLTHQGHRPGVSLRIEDDEVAVRWSASDDRAAGSHADPQEATEHGAVAIAIQLVRHGTGLTVVRRSRKGTGFDWHLGPHDAPAPFASTACLEVSGILNETPALMERRIKDKVAQVRRGGLGLPGYAVVVGFLDPAALVRSVL